MRLGSDGLAGVIGLCISALLTWQSFGLPSLPMVPVGPGFYPRIVLAVLALASIALIVESLRANWSKADVTSRDGPALHDGAAQAGYGRVALGFLVVTAYVFALPYLGFRIATVVFVASMLAAIERPRTPAAWMTAAAIAVATSAVTWLAFERYLAVLLPRGLWTGW